jgi:protein involved in polysaccharide export with SLBB domain
MKLILVSLKSILLFVLFISFNSFFYSQSFSPEYFRNINVSSISDIEVRNIKEQMDKQNKTFAEIEPIAMSSGMNATDFQTLKAKIEALTPLINQTNVENGIVLQEKPIELDKTAGIDYSDIYGSEFFLDNNLNFEPSSHLIPPGTYVIGPGDEFSIIIYGMQESLFNVYVNKEGKIQIPNIGQIYVNGLSFDAAKLLIKKSCSKIYTSLSSGQSTISTTLTKLRSIKITILGAKNPGNYTVSSLSTIFNALHVAGGPGKNGSFRNIELIRNNKVIKKVDIYKFLTTGDLSDNISLVDFDVIRIPMYENRVQISGNIKRPGIFELLPEETFEDLIKYCSGFTEGAYKENIKLIQNAKDGLRIVDLTEEKYKNYKPQLGDVFKVTSILNKYENKVSIKGSVLRPDEYELTENMKLSELIKKADGLTQDAFKNRAILIREKDDLTKEMINVNINSVISGAFDLALRKNDEIVISSIFDFNSQQHVTVFGYVNNNGEFPFVENLTLYDVILQAGGLSRGASKTVEIASILSSDEKTTDQSLKSIIKNYEIDTLLLDLTKNVKLNPFDVISIRKKPIFEMPKYVSVLGQVMFPGNYAIASSNERLLDFIDRAGGLLDDANINSIYVIRDVDRVATRKVEKINKQIPIDYQYIKNHPNSNKNIFLKNNDQIFIEKIDNTVKIYGSVYLNTEIPFSKRKKIKYYVNAVGGYNNNADKKRIYIVKANGLGAKTKRFLFFKKYPKVELGCEIHIPEKPVDNNNNNNKLSIVEMSIITGVLGSLTTMTLAIINLTK